MKQQTQKFVKTVDIIIKDNVRKDVTEQSIKTLAASIQRYGLLQPLLVRDTPKGLELVAGHRRLKACQIAGVDVVPVIHIKISRIRYRSRAAGCF